MFTKEFNKSNEVLYILKSAQDSRIDSISKIGIQKVFYLANLLAPIKNLILATIDFLSQKRGPYSSSLQNIVDQLVANGYVEIVSFKNDYGRWSLASYSISKAGEQVVDNLIVYEKEKEKLWWYKTIVKLSKIYSKQDILVNEENYGGFDNIVNLVYQDLTYLKYKNETELLSNINLKDEHEPTYLLINFIKDYIIENDLIEKNFGKNKIAEIILIAYFDFLYSKYLDNKYD